jgi:hypothetical protein
MTGPAACSAHTSAPLSPSKANTLPLAHPTTTSPLPLPARVQGEGAGGQNSADAKMGEPVSTSHTTSSHDAELDGRWWAKHRTSPLVVQATSLAPRLTPPPCSSSSLPSSSGATASLAPRPAPPPPLPLPRHPSPPTPCPSSVPARGVGAP